MRFHTRPSSILLILFTCLTWLAPLNADIKSGYPKPINDYVNDFAEILTPDARDAIEMEFKRLEYQTGIEAVVVTIDSISDYKTHDSSIELFAKNLFNAWKIGHKKSNDGILFLVSVHDRKLRIELGGSYAHRYDARMQKIVDKIIIPKFINDELCQGVVLGAFAIKREITVPVSWIEFYKWHLAIGIISILLIFSGIFFESRGKKGLAWLCFGIGFGLVVWLINLLFRGKSTSGFGGGSSGGGGASGSW